jgi:hypothetical protein
MKIHYLHEQFELQINMSLQNEILNESITAPSSTYPPTIYPLENTPLETPLDLH